jgi:hypothetical protein
MLWVLRALALRGTSDDGPVECHHMTVLLDAIEGLRHGEERPCEAGRVTNHAQRRMPSISYPASKRVTAAAFGARGHKVVTAAGNC